MRSIIEDLATNLSSEPIEILEMMARRLATESLADGCFIVVEENRIFKPLTSSSDVEMLESPYAFESALTNQCGIVVTDMLQLPEHLCAVMCIPIIVNHKKADYKDEKRWKTNDYKRMKGYIYFQSENAINRFSQEFITECESIVPIIGNCIELYQTFMIASTDKLTGALNRKYMDTRLNSCMERAKRRKENFSVIMIDLDFFKHVNDTYGHLVGDDVLRETSRIIRENLRKGDILGRYGGEEFIVMLNNTDSDSAREMAELLRVRIFEARILSDKRDITISLGVATYPIHADSVKSLMEKADKALYIAKKTGRNKYEMWDNSLGDMVIEKDTKQEFFSGDNAKDRSKVLVLFKIMETTRLNIQLEEKITIALGEVLNVVGASDIALFLTKDGKVTESFRFTQSGGALQYNDKIIEEVIDTKRCICMVDWDNDKIDVTTSITDWQSIVVVPAVGNGLLKGILYASVSIKKKEFKADEKSFIYHAATVISTMIQ